MQIQFLYFSGCPSYKQGLENLKQALKELQLPEDFEMINIKTDEMAKEYHFIGSPTIVINGQDIDPKARDAKVTGYKGCRIYQTEQGLKGAPTIEMIKKSPSTSLDSELDSRSLGQVILRK